MGVRRVKLDKTTYLWSKQHALTRRWVPEITTNHKRKGWN